MTTRLSILALVLLAGCCPTAPPAHVCTEITARTFTVERIVDVGKWMIENGHATVYEKRR